MHLPPIPGNESTRLETLRALNILDTSPEERFDRLTRLAKRLFGVPIALVSLVDADRQWFKSCVGLSASETSRDVSFARMQSCRTRYSRCPTRWPTTASTTIRS